MLFDCICGVWPVQQPVEICGCARFEPHCGFGFYYRHDSCCGNDAFCQKNAHQLLRAGSGIPDDSDYSQSVFLSVASDRSPAFFKIQRRHAEHHDCGNR